MRQTWTLVAAVASVLAVATGGVEAATIIRWGDVVAADHPAVRMIGATAPFLIPLVAVLLLITVFPELVLFLPRLLLGP